MVITFLPALFLSGFLFDLRSMPAAIRVISYALPARYYVNLLQTLFLAGNIWGVVLPNAAVLAGHGRRAAGGGASGHNQTAGMRRAMVEAILRILALIHKELLAILKDPRSRVSLFMPPVLQCLIFGLRQAPHRTPLPKYLSKQHRKSRTRMI